MTISGELGPDIFLLPSWDGGGIAYSAVATANSFESARNAIFWSWERRIVGELGP